MHDSSYWVVRPIYWLTDWIVCPTQLCRERSISCLINYLEQLRAIQTELIGLKLVTSSWAVARQSLVMRCSPRASEFSRSNWKWSDQWSPQKSFISNLDKWTQCGSLFSRLFWEQWFQDPKYMFIYSPYLFLISKSKHLYLIS